MIIELEDQSIERLEQMVRVLKELSSDKKLNMASWRPCGTTACACGWAAQDPWFIERDFRIEKDKSEYEVYQVYHGIHVGRRAVQEFFGIRYQDFEYLFLPNMNLNGRTKEAVIDRLESFIKVKRRYEE